MKYCTHVYAIFQKLNSIILCRVKVHKQDNSFTSSRRSWRNLHKFSSLSKSSLSCWTFILTFSCSAKSIHSTYVHHYQAQASITLTRATSTSMHADIAVVVYTAKCIILYIIIKLSPAFNYTSNEVHFCQLCILSQILHVMRPTIYIHFLYALYIYNYICYNI